MEWICNPAQSALPETCFLLTNGLGGYCSQSVGFGAPRADQGVLVAAVKAPNVRVNLVQRLEEVLTVGEKTAHLCCQTFADGTPAQQALADCQETRVGWIPRWQYVFEGVTLERTCVMQWEKNTVAVLYTLKNDSPRDCSLMLTPWMKFAPKEDAVKEKKQLRLEGYRVTDGKYDLYIHTDGCLEADACRWQELAYPEDEKDGRPGKGMAAACCRVVLTVGAGETVKRQVVFSAEPETVSGWQILEQSQRRKEELAAKAPFSHPIARQLVLAADAYIARRESTGGKTILAGHPLFSDWGRDTMIALPGCTLSTGRYEDAKSILRTFLAYEKDGLVPNLFPEGDQAPMYNTVDAALLLIDAVWLYLQKTGDRDFLREAWPVMERIVAFYRKGTIHGIGMDSDGLIFAGKGLDQVTWMDVCIDGVLPTPRHGKPVEINAYWYNALKIMAVLAKDLGKNGEEYAELAEKVRVSFEEKFYIPEKGYLRDVISGTEADSQIRCNQIWALAMDYPVLVGEKAQRVLDTVTKHLLTDRGLRTLSPEDKQYHPHYGGCQYDRDMAYHQGTTWVFPMGAYFRAWLKLRPYEADKVLARLELLAPMLEEGCLGQLPEIYDGTDPYEGKGCFAQAWSVGEMLRVFELLEKGGESC